MRLSKVLVAAAVIMTALVGCSSPEVTRCGGIDVSHHNGRIDWTEVAKDTACIQFVYVKATEGTTLKDPNFIQNMKGARKAGMKVGAYHFFRMTSSAHSQFRSFSKELDKVKFDLVPMVDVEVKDKASNEAVRDSLMVFIDLIRQKYGVSPLIYGSNKSYNMFCGDEVAGDCPLFIARYGPNPPMIKGLRHYTLWQYSEKGHISGIRKPVDLSRFHPSHNIMDIMMPEGPKVSIEHKEGLIIYTPKFSRIDLATAKMPSKNDKEVIFCCEAAFTGEKKLQFSHKNIAGHHVSGGTFYEGYKCGPNNGVFTWSEKTGWKFYNYGHNNSEAPLKAAAENGGMGFCQSLLYLNGQRFKGCMKPERINQYRALCEIKGKLCIVDCENDMTFGKFMDTLQKIGVKNAMYCDMGLGWNYSWYRDENGNAVDIYPTAGKFTTNWLTFYK